MSEFLCIISIFHNFCWCPNSHTGVRKSATFAGVRIRTLVCEKKNSELRSVCKINSAHFLSYRDRGGGRFVKSREFVLMTKKVQKMSIILKS